MRDTDLRGLVLQYFYDHRRIGLIGVNTENIPDIKIPKMDWQEIARICVQLHEHGLVDWGQHSHRIGGAGRITAKGSDVIEGTAQSPISIQIDSSHHVQHISITDSENVQVAGANSSQQQNVTQALEKLTNAIDEAPGTPEEKETAKSKVATFLHGALKNVTEGGVRALIDSFKT